MDCVIGMPLCLDDRERWRRGRRYQYADAAYARALERARALPVWLPIQERPERVVEQIDGLLLPGGDDLEPPRPYPTGVRFEAAPAPQLEFDRALLAAALGAGLPVLGICYGMQLLALERGARLHYDLATDLPQAAEHQLVDSERHPVKIEPDSRLARLLGATQVRVNSLHHQAVAEPGELRVTGRSADGVVEAVETREGELCVGVQWHPEKLDDAPSRELFAGFVRVARGRRA